MGSSIGAGLDSIKGDREKGASQLAEIGLQLMAGVCAVAAREKPEKLMEIARNTASQLADIRPSMAPIGNWAIAFVIELEKRASTGSLVPGESGVGDVLDCVLDRKNLVTKNLVDKARKVTQGMKSLFTLSYSSTVEKILLEAAPQNLITIVAESRPLFEGRRLVESLSNAGKKVNCITDSQMGKIICEVDIALLGADTICNDLGVINKSGSYLAALAARDNNKPLVIAADTYKINCRTSSEAIELEEKPGEEVWPERGEICSNIYFEPVPPKLISSYLTEKGVLNHDEMLMEVEKLRQFHESAFGS